MEKIVTTPEVLAHYVSALRALICNVERKNVRSSWPKGVSFMNGLLSFVERRSAVGLAATSTMDEMARLFRDIEHGRAADQQRSYGLKKLDRLEAALQFAKPSDKARRFRVAW